ncbi:D-alanyl-D-alanine carboxypeptidase [Salinibacillus kushneri]|uniref:D-alanyl-D-alanine carboxypeptidase n=1 Tax=Salinibacillus kushneri TaxID=237682 RepID=A0A1I0CFQ9_9BACI|nr:D-alanyl-D-alanine carboxypeptidase [Salinibacillus kushneri]
MLYLNLQALVFIPFFIIFIFIVGCTQDQEQSPTENEQEEQSADDKQEDQSDSEEIDKTLEKQEAEQFIQSFREQLIQETDQNLRVKNFNHKEELINNLSKLADPELAKQYVDVFYKEENNHLYLIPKNGPVLLNKNIPYKLAKNEQGLYYVSQENENEMMGKYSLYILFNRTENRWMIKDIKLDVEEQHDDDDLSDQEKKKQEPTEEVVYSNQQIEQQGTMLLVNKTHTLPQDYVPEDLVIPDVLFSFEKQLPKKQMKKEAAQALEDMFHQAKAEDINLYAVSGYRSYKRQDQIFQYNVNQHGEEYANQFSAKPGESEHQTGLTMDITSRSVSD